MPSFNAQPVNPNDPPPLNPSTFPYGDVAFPAAMQVTGQSITSAQQAATDQKARLQDYINNLWNLKSYAQMAAKSVGQRGAAGLQNPLQVYNSLNAMANQAGIPIDAEISKALMQGDNIENTLNGLLQNAGSIYSHLAGIQASGGGGGGGRSNQPQRPDVGQQMGTRTDIEGNVYNAQGQKIGNVNKGSIYKSDTQKDVNQQGQSDRQAGQDASNQGTISGTAPPPSSPGDYNSQNNLGFTNDTSGLDVLPYYSQASTFDPSNINFNVTPPQDLSQNLSFGGSGGGGNNLGFNVNTSSLDTTGMLPGFESFGGDHGTLSGLLSSTGFTPGGGDTGGFGASGSWGDGGGYNPMDSSAGFAESSGGGEGE